MRTLLLLGLLLLSCSVSQAQTGTAGEADAGATTALETLTHQMRESRRFRKHWEISKSLPGLWKVSLCVKVPSHAWIRFENAETKQVLTMSRFDRFSGGGLKWRFWEIELDKEIVWTDGIWMNRELCHEGGVAQGRYVMLSTYVRDPLVFRGQNDGVGHGGVVNNCVTYTRDAWQFYTGEYYDLPRFHSPVELRAAVLKGHPEILARTRATSAPQPRSTPQRNSRPDPITQTGLLLSSEK